MYRAWATIIVAAILSGTSGCGGSGEDMIDAQELLDRYEKDRRRHDPKSFVEVDLGEYLITQQRKTDKQLVFVRFHLYGVVHEKQASEFSSLLNERKDRMRDQVLAAVQKSEVAQLNDPSLGWIKSELIPAINRTLQTRILRDVVFAEFSMEQG